MSDEKWEPKIVGFACNWCAYAGADLAGTARLPYPANVSLIRVMCTGSIDVTHVLAAFARGADGVFIGGCHPGDCHYLSGNFKAQARVALAKRLLAQFGIEPKRLYLEWISASEGAKFADVIAQFTERVRELGPNPTRLELGSRL